MTLKIRVGKMDVEKGDKPIVESEEQSTAQARSKSHTDEVKRRMREHIEKLKHIPSIKQPKPGELIGVSLEEEFEE